MRTVLANFIARFLLLFAAAVWFASTKQASAETYYDAIAEEFSGSSALDITSVEVTTEGTDLLFKINLSGNPLTSTFGKYMIGIQGSGGAASGNGWLRPISISSGMRYWIGSWVDWGTGFQVWAYENNAWVLKRSGTPTLSASSVQLRVSLEEIGSGYGNIVKFDAYSSVGTGDVESAADALSASTSTITSWTQWFTSGTLSQYQVPAAPAYPSPIYPGSITSPGPSVSNLNPLFQWDKVTGAAGYGLYIRDTTNDTLVYNDDLVGSGSTSFQLPAGILQPGRQYRWNMRVRSPEGVWSPYSNRLYFATSATPFSAPGPLEIQPFANKVRLGWTDNTSDEDGFRIERSDNNGASWFTLASLSPANGAVPGLSYDDYNTRGSTLYGYRIRAYKDTNYSDYSNSAFATTPAGPPGSFSLSNDPAIWDAPVSGGKVALVWTSSPNASGYTVYRDGTILPGGGGVQSPFIDSQGLSSGSVHTYYIRAANAEGTTDSNPVTVTMPSAPPTSATISNVRAAQRSGTKYVDIHFSISTTQPVSITIQGSSNGGENFVLPMTSISGQVGGGIGAGTDKLITWNAGADWANQMGSAVCFRVSTAGSQATSSTLTVDTRSIPMSGLVVSGPSSVTSGWTAPFAAILTNSDGSSQEVTSQCVWTVTGGGPVSNGSQAASMNGNILTPGPPSINPLKIAASLIRDTGRVLSNQLSVVVQEGTDLDIGITWPSHPGPDYLRKEGTSFAWRYAALANGGATTNQDVTIKWFLNGVQVGSGPSLDREFSGPPGMRNLMVVATTQGGKHGSASAYIPFDVPTSPEEPHTGIKAPDPGIGDVVDETGDTLYFDPAKTANGLIVITHGLQQDSSAKWLLDMAKGIRIRLQEEHRPLPNIVVYGWGPWAHPSQYWGVDIPYASIAENIVLIRPHGLSIGREMADWMNAQIGNGNVSASAPIHLIGHSAGGFVVGECGYQLRTKLSNIRVTLLDTPYPDWNLLTKFPGAGRKLDRYVSSLIGTLENPLSTLVEAVAGKYDYVLLGNAPSISAHSYAHEWYDDSVWFGEVGSRGFGWSPTFSGAAAAAAPFPLNAPRPPLSISASPTDSPVSGFTFFGTVSTVPQGFLITEGDQANAGVSRPGFLMPIGAQSISFRFQFTRPGDGDFVIVSHGEDIIGYATCNMTSQSSEITVNMAVDHLAGRTGDLVFRLVSRGDQNAVVTLKGIAVAQIEDTDGDGLSNADEISTGTNPLSSDSDHDGLSDPVEINGGTDPTSSDTDGDGTNDGAELTAGTDPRNSASRFEVSSVIKSGQYFTLYWKPVVGKRYRVVRSDAPDFNSYEVVGSDIPASLPLQSFTDSGKATTQRGFYRVEIEP